MPGGRKKNKKENNEESVDVENLRKLMKDQTEISGFVEEAFLRGDYDKLPGCESLKQEQAAVDARAIFELRQDMMKKMARVDGNPMVCYEESDQTPLRRDLWLVLRSKWATGMDYTFSGLTVWAQALYRGDYAGVLEIIKGKSENQLKKLLSMRESMMNLGAVFHLVQGARNCGRALDDKNEHIKILYKLISLGVDVNARDVAGFTALHQCVQRHGNDVTLKIAEILIKAGAEVDSKNRFGETPLIDCTLGNRLDFVSLLLKHGANPSSKDNAGVCPLKLAFYNPQIRTMFGKAENDRAKVERKELKEKTGGRLSACSVCRASTDTKKCSGCFSVWFCGRDCQRAAWPDHREKCKETRAQYSMFNMSPSSNSVGQDQITGEFYETKSSGGLRKQHFVVKIQLVLSQERALTPVKGNPMLIYDKNKTFMFHLRKEFNEVFHPRLERMIREHGVLGLKGYFHAIVAPSQASAKKDESSELVKMEINIENILPWEAW